MESLRILIVGMPFTPIFEVGDRLSEFHELDLFTIESRDALDIDEYFVDKIPANRLDTGDLSDGSEHQQWTRDWDLYLKSREMDGVVVPNPDNPLDEDEREEINSVVRGIVVSQVPDVFLAEWADCVIMLRVEDKKMREWLKDRRKCFSCGAVYHLRDKPMTNPPLCDRCGTMVRMQSQDHPRFVNKQYALWKKKFNHIEKMMKEVKPGRKFLDIDVDKADDFQGLVDEVSEGIRGMVNIDAGKVRWTYSI